MMITIGPELQAALAAAAARHGTDPETLAVETLRGTFVPMMPQPMTDEEWIKGLRGAAIDCGVSLSDEDVSREAMYD